jgi:Putative auto-transporter adhesin, head GIN domain
MKAAYVLTLVLTSVILVSGCVQITTNQSTGSGTMATETRNVATFTTINFAVPGTLLVTQSDTQSVKVEAESDVISRVRTEVSNGILTIDAATPIVTTRPINVYVALSAIDGINNDGAGTVTSDALLTTNALNLTLRGAGSFNINLNTQELTTRISGAGSAKLNGNATNHTAVLAGVGSLRSYDLATETTSITIEGVGSAEVTATKNLDVTITGAGSVRYHGDPEVYEQRAGVGSLQKTG